MQDVTLLQEVTDTLGPRRLPVENKSPSPVNVEYHQDEGFFKFLLQILFHFLGQGWNHIKEVANYAIISLLEYGGIRILIDGHNHL